MEGKLCYAQCRAISMCVKNDYAECKAIFIIIKMLLHIAKSIL